MAVKRDSVNRKENLIRVIPAQVALPHDVKAGDEIELVDVVENDITPDIKDPMVGFGHPDGTNYGDAVFDSMAEGAENMIFDPMA